MDKQSFIEAVRAGGIVGEGGAGFPSHVKFNAEAAVVIANGCECEPLLHTDHQILKHHPDLVLAGLAALSGATGAERAVLALKRKHNDLVPMLEKKCGERGIELFLLDDFYPAGDEQILLREVTGRSVPPQGIPLNVGAVISNVGTLKDVAAAVGAGGSKTPLTGKTLTVTGEVETPAVLTAPLGTPLAECLAACGGSRVKDPVFILGGPMMGRVVPSLEALAGERVTKTTGGLVVLPSGHYLHRNAVSPVEQMRRRAASACIQCRACSDLCPRNLIGHPFETHRVMRAFAAGTERELQAGVAALCCECGACEHYACPMGMSPRRINQTVKAVIRSEGLKYQGPLELDESSTHWRDYRKIPTKRLAARLGLSAYLDIETPYLGELTPRRVEIPLRQHIGVPAEPLVAVGNKVKAGDLIAEIPANALGARVHASIGGIIAEVGERITITAD